MDHAQVDGGGVRCASKIAFFACLIFLNALDKFVGQLSELHQLFASEAMRHAVCPRGLTVRKARYRGSAFGGRQEKFGAHVIWILGVGRKFPINQDVGDPLHALAGQAHMFCNLRNRLCVLQDSAENLPLRRADARRFCNCFRGIKNAPVQAEHFQNNRGQYLRGGSLSDRHLLSGCACKN